MPGSAPGGPPPPRVPARAGGPPDQTAILGAGAASPVPWYRRLEPRFAALAVAGVLVVGGAAAFAVSKLAEEESPRRDDNPSQAAQSEEDASQAAGGGSLAPSSITVSVLNGTTVPGLARSLGDQVEKAGFRLGNVSNFTDQQKSESVVLFAPGNEREAAFVGRRLKIAQREPVDAESQSLAGDASVVIIAGNDQTP
jgi:hypothetical protein